MDKLTWHNIESELRKDRPPSSVWDKESFWQEFEARAAKANQEMVTDTPFRLLLMNRWMKVAALIVLVGAIAFFTTKDHDVPLVRNKIKNLEVFASYSAMIIMDDSESEGTIVWITDLESTEK